MRGHCSLPPLKKREGVGGHSPPTPHSGWKSRGGECPPPHPSGSTTDYRVWQMISHNLNFVYIYIHTLWCCYGNLILIIYVLISFLTLPVYMFCLVVYNTFSWYWGTDQNCRDQKLVNDGEVWIECIDVFNGEPTYSEKDLSHYSTAVKIFEEQHEGCHQCTALYGEPPYLKIPNRKIICNKQILWILGEKCSKTSKDDSRWIKNFHTKFGL